jgi:hypothetical protein
MKKILCSFLGIFMAVSAFAQVQIDKQVQMTGALPNDRRITNVSNASTVTPVGTDAININTVQQNYVNYSAGTFAGGTYALTLVPAPAAYTAGMRITFRASAANTGATNVNVNALGARPLVRHNGVALNAGEIYSGQIVEAVYDATSAHFEVISNIKTDVTSYHVYNTAGRLAVTSTTLTLQPGMTQTITIPAGMTAKAHIHATCGTRNVDATSGDYSHIDAVIFLDGAALASGGWNRLTTVNHSSSNSFGQVSIVTQVTLTAGAHTIELRTKRVSGNTAVDIGGDAVLDATAGEMTIYVYYQ